MSDGTIIVHGDALQFDPQFGNRTVTPTGPATISGTGLAKVGGKKICIAGDQGQVKVAASYLIPGFSPGQGEITITALGPDQQKPMTKAGAAIIVKGSKFTASFRPTSPATQPSGPPDSTTPTPGTGGFVASQTFAKAP